MKEEWIKFGRIFRLYHLFVHRGYCTTSWQHRLQWYLLPLTCRWSLSWLGINDYSCVHFIFLLLAIPNQKMLLIFICRGNRIKLIFCIVS